MQAEPSTLTKSPPPKLAQAPRELSIPIAPNAAPINFSFTPPGVGLYGLTGQTPKIRDRTSVERDPLISAGQAWFRLRQG